MTEFLKRNTPPGMELKTEKNWFIAGNAAAFLICIFGFISRYLDARRDLYEFIDGKELLIEGSEIPHFYALVGLSGLGFAFVTLCMLSFTVYHYLYYRQGSMSIYLMKRLPRRGERHRRAVALPCILALTTLVISLIAILICFAIYLLATPRGCLPNAVWQELWRIF